MDIIENTLLNNGTKYDFNAKYLKGKMYIQVNRYLLDNSICLSAIEKYGARVPLTVCVEGAKPEPGHVLIKTWSENEGVLEELVRLGIVQDTGVKIRTGHTYANLCKLMI